MHTLKPARGTVLAGAAAVSALPLPGAAPAYDPDAGTLHASTGAGRTPVPGASGLPSGDDQSKVAAAPGRVGDLWLSTKWNGLYRSTDGGVGCSERTSCWASYTLGFGKGAADYPAVYQVGATDAVTAVLRSDDAGASWTRINDDRHQWDWTGEVITGDPRVYGRVYLGTNGRGIQYGEPV